MSRGSQFIVRSIVACIALAGACSVHAQESGARTIRIVAPEAGGAADLVARLVAQGIIAAYKEQAIVDNRGGNQVIPIQLVTKAPPDGYTLLVISNGLWTLPYLQNVPYDPLRDLTGVTLAASTPLILTIHPSLPVKNLREFIALGKQRPGELNYASGPSGTSNHLAAELFRSMAGVNLMRVSYKGTVPALNDLISGQVQVMFANVPPVKPHVSSGRLRALAVTSAAPSQVFPGVPTMAASGVPGYVSESLVAFYAPAGTPESTIARLNQEFVTTLNRAEVRERLLNAAVEVVGSTPEHLSATMKAEMARMGKVIKDANIHLE
jgi:tripartite-type tricarboxylate transporter receptor subunit TctC